LAVCVQATHVVNRETEVLKARTKKCALDVLDFVETIPQEGSNRRIRAKLGRTSAHNRKPANLK